MTTAHQRRLMRAAEKLREARKLIGAKTRWTQRSYARDKNGRTVSYSGKAAVSFCALGALSHVGAPAESTDALTREVNLRYGKDLIQLNDSNGDESRKKILIAMTSAANTLERAATK